MNRNGLIIGEFSRLCRVTVRALRHYMMKVYGPYNLLNENIRGVLEWIEVNGYTITYPPRYSYVDGIWNQEDPEKWLTIIQVPVTR